MKILKGLVYAIALVASLALLFMTIEYRRVYRQLETDRNPAPHVRQVTVPTTVAPAPVLQAPIMQPAPTPLKAVPSAPVKPAAKPTSVSGFSPASAAVPMVQAVNRNSGATPYSDGLRVSWQYYDHQKRGTRAKPLPPGVYHLPYGEVTVHQR